MEYRIVFKSDETFDSCGLTSHDWALVRTCNCTIIMLRESARLKSSEDAATVLEAAWAGFRELTRNS